MPLLFFGSGCEQIEHCVKEEVVVEVVEVVEGVWRILKGGNR